MAPELSISYIDDGIARVQNYLSELPRSHQLHIDCVHALATARFLRYRRLQQKEDLDKYILHYTESIFLRPPSMTRHSCHVIEILFDLASALLVRSLISNQSKDIESSIEYLQYLQGLPLESFGISRKVVTAKLIQTLAVQVQLEAGHGTPNIAEIVALFRELFTISADSGILVGALMHLNKALEVEHSRGKPIPFLDEVIGVVISEVSAISEQA
ncbi:hypothetical protein EI94DRAFT_1699040 [Lactarius quietus]|nr:hypothetical protein EI94DRAFT_1699040 [Lactarius quietus]